VGWFEWGYWGGCEVVQSEVGLWLGWGELGLPCRVVLFRWRDLCLVVGVGGLGRSGCCLPLVRSCQGVIGGAGLCGEGVCAVLLSSGAGAGAEERCVNEVER